MKQVLAKKFTMLEGLPEDIIRSFGQLSIPLIGIIWGLSGQGKTNLLMKILKVFLSFGRVLYISLEEGHEVTMKNTLERHFNDDMELAKNLTIADQEMTFEKLCVRLDRPRSPKFIIIDSLQYWNISYEDYKELKRRYPRKSFLFISHAEGKEPLGKTARSIRYDAGLKIKVEGYVAFIVSRYGGGLPYVVWEDGAKRYWGKKYKSITQQPKQPPKPKKDKDEQEADSPNPF